MYILEMVDYYIEANLDVKAFVILITFLNYSAASLRYIVVISFYMTIINFMKSF